MISVHGIPRSALLFPSASRAKDGDDGESFNPDSSDTAVAQQGPEPDKSSSVMSNPIWMMQSGAGSYINPPSEGELAAKATERQFSDFSNMSLGDFIRARYLARHHLSEDQLAAMPEGEREAIEKEIAEDIKREMAGVVQDKSHPEEGDPILEPPPSAEA